ncbi:MAG TPA: ATP-binding domain-containing protein, partial [Salinisphaeraceae bacterium]|nr:ATP-binding domain-containing protein [Salinisphaeraceae bacterium]
SQGSEFDHVTLVLPDYDVPVLTRELLYTGLTRARRRLTVHAHTAILRRTLARRISRVSGLAGRIAGAGNSAGHFGASTLQA